MTDVLQKVREKEKNVLNGKKAEDIRPGFHLTPPVGWMNDPNGLSYYDGKYHLFFQYHPYKTEWGPMHWGHAVSEDLIRWEYLPCAMAPDAPADKDGCFSGTAMELSDGRQLLMYTGVSGDKQNQCLAVGDGRDYEKAAQNPVITGAQLPEDCVEADFRDPKIWRGEDGSFYAAAVTCTEDRDGRVLIFRGESSAEQKDGGLPVNWSYVGALAENAHRYGRMWECPDYFTLEGKKVLVVSPQDMRAGEFKDSALPCNENKSGNCNMAFLGTGDDRSFTEERAQLLDYGIDYYAAETTKAPDGRRIQVAWMQNWDTAGAYRRPGLPWFGQMTLPRELFLKEGRLFQRPVRELEAYRRDRKQVQGLEIRPSEDFVPLKDIAGRSLDLHLGFRELKGIFEIRFAEGTMAGHHQYTLLTVDACSGKVEVDRSHSGQIRACADVSRYYAAPLARNKRACDGADEPLLELELILDRFSSELFIAGGEAAMTNAIFTDPAAEGISVRCRQGAVVDIEAYKLEI